MPTRCVRNRPLPQEHGHLPDVGIVLTVAHQDCLQPVLGAVEPTTTPFFRGSLTQAGNGPSRDLSTVNATFIITYS